MPSHAFRVHGAGIGLADLLHGDIDFSAARLAPYRSLKPGDGGLEMGKVIFKNDLLRFAAANGKPVAWDELLADLVEPSPAGGTDEAAEPAFNAGGPAIASLALAAQLLRPSRTPVTYYGVSGDDGLAARMRHLLAQTPLDMTCFRQRPGRTLSTHVFHDRNASGGHGDRFFVHVPGGDPEFDPALIDESFFQATFAVFAGTALVPGLHRNLPALLQKGRRRGSLNIVGTVHDFAAEKNAPGKPWPMGEGDPWPHVDLLVADAEELFGLAGSEGEHAGGRASGDLEKAVDALLARGLTSAVVTRGADPVYYRSLGGIFGECRGYAPVHAGLSAAARAGGNIGDTIGAGDNFLGGLIADLMHQILADDFYPKGEVHIERELLQVSPLRLRRAIDFAVVAGGLACLQTGGIALEKSAGERLKQIRSYLPPPLPGGRPW